MHSIVKWLSLASFLLLSLPATSQSATVINGDTLICFPDEMVRKIIADLESGDLAKKEVASYKVDISNLRLAIEAKDGQIANLNTKASNLQAIVQERDRQLGLKDDEIKVLKKDKKGNFFKGLFGGTLAGAITTVALILL